MGRRQESITITAQLSSRSDEQDDIDEARWEELRGRIDALLQEDRYVDISPMVV